MEIDQNYNENIYTFVLCISLSLFSSSFIFFWLICDYLFITPYTEMIFIFGLPFIIFNMLLGIFCVYSFYIRCFTSESEEKKLFNENV